MVGHRAQQLVGVPHRRHHIEPAVGQQLGETLPQQHRVLSYHDSHGNSTVMIVGPPGGLSTMSVPSTAAARCASPSRPDPVSKDAPPRPSSRTTIRSRPACCETATSAVRASACLLTLLSVSDTTK